MSPSRGLLLLILIFSISLSQCRRRVSESSRIKAEGVQWHAEGAAVDTETTTLKTTSTTSPSGEETTKTTTLPTTTISVEDPVLSILSDASELANLTRLVEEEHAESLEDALNRTVLWIDASYKAIDFNLNTSIIPECKLWRKSWNITIDDEDEKSNNTVEETTPMADLSKLKETELIDSTKRLKALGLNETLLEIYKAVGIVYKEVCGDHERILWFRGTEEAKRLGITETSPICGPFKEALNPDKKTLVLLAKQLNELIYNISEGVIEKQPISSNYTYTEDGISLVELVSPRRQSEEWRQTSSARGTTVATSSEATTSTTEDIISEIAQATSEDITRGSILVLEESKNDVRVIEQTPKHDTHQAVHPPIDKDLMIYDNDDYWDYKDLEQRMKIPQQRVKRRVRIRFKREGEKAAEGPHGDDDDWLDNIEPTSESVAKEEAASEAEQAEESPYTPWVEIDATDEVNPVLLIASPEAVNALSLNIPLDAFSRHQKVGLFLPGICADYVPKAIDEFDSSNFEGVEIEGPIGVNISALEAAGVNLTALAEKLRNDTEVDAILSRTNGSMKTLGGSFILPVLNKNQYDPFSAPIVFQGSAVEVRFGIYIESMSNFQTSTMDYDMDIYLMMAWRDARLVNPYDKPILVKEEDILEKIWRPDPFFANAKEAEFHEVTFLNFLMRIYPDGLVLYETRYDMPNTYTFTNATASRVKITPSCNLILCKYPHDKQTCHLLIKSFAYPIETVRFEWFTRRENAIDKNPDVKLPELYIDRYEPTSCNKTRKSGSFSCLRAVFRLKRDVGFHIAQTYIPTSLALMFSWVGVWLPEEFMEGRIGVAITVLLTLSTESAGAREHLPSVSYLKAIDLWFGFITGFVFFTLLQTLFVIGFDKRANQLRKWAMKKKSDVTEELRDAMLEKANRYHKTGRYLDNFCRVFYPLSFILFLILYYFVFTEGRQDDCINRR